MNKTIYDMKLHEELRINGNIDITRVPGGWLYCTYVGDGQHTTTFVRYDNEFWEDTQYREKPPTTDMRF